jgi:hypothetical protein
MIDLLSKILFIVEIQPQRSQLGRAATKKIYISQSPQRPQRFINSL